NSSIVKILNNVNSHFVEKLKVIKFLGVTYDNNKAFNKLQTRLLYSSPSIEKIEYRRNIRNEKRIIPTFDMVTSKMNQMATIAMTLNFKRICKDNSLLKLLCSMLTPKCIEKK